MSAQPILEIENLQVVYDKAIQAVSSVSLRVPQKQIVALLGANGAGKTTTLKAISGLIEAEGGESRSSRLHYKGADLNGTTPKKRVESGLVQVLEGRHCFKQLSVEENLKLGAYIRKPERTQLADALEEMYQYFPRLKLLRNKKAGLTSGGEQQMIAIGRALIAKPLLVLLDEPSMGLAPQIVEEIFEIVRNLNQVQGISFLLAEQNASLALAYADQAYILENGRVTGWGLAAELIGRDDIRAAYLGGTGLRDGFKRTRPYSSRSALV